MTKVWFGSKESKVNFFSDSKISTMFLKGKQEFVIVGAAESDPLKGFISNESPLGNAFLGKKKGEKIKVKTPKGEVEYKILDVK